MSTLLVRRRRLVLLAAALSSMLLLTAACDDQERTALEQSGPIATPSPSLRPLVTFHVNEAELQPGEPFTLRIDNPKKLCTDTFMDLEQEFAGEWEPRYRLVLPYDSMERGHYFSVDQTNVGQHDIALCGDGPVPMLLPPLEPGVYRLTNDYGGNTPYIVGMTFEI
jgi:hypothetical protein